MTLQEIENYARKAVNVGHSFVKGEKTAEQFVEAVEAYRLYVCDPYAMLAMLEDLTKE